VTQEQAAKVLARVGDHVVTLGDYAAALEHMDPFDRLRFQSPERRQELLGELINIELLAREATAKGYDKDPLTQEEVRTILRDAMFKEARRGAPAPADIKEEQARAYFEAHKADYRDPERRRISAIVTSNEPAARAVLESATKDASPVAWGELVRAKSIDSQARAQVPLDLIGDMGIVGPAGDPRGSGSGREKVPEEVRAAAFEIAKVNDVLNRAVAAGGRFYVVRLTQKLEAHARTFAEAERTIRVKLAQDQMRAAEQRLVDGLREKFPVQIDEAALAAVKVDLADPAVSDRDGGAPKN
jgi:DNA-directed RNA polymerase subunit F